MSYSGFCDLIVGVVLLRFTVANAFSISHIPIIYKQSYAFEPDPAPWNLLGRLKQGATEVP